MYQQDARDSDKWQQPSSVSAGRPSDGGRGGLLGDDADHGHRSSRRGGDDDDGERSRGRGVEGPRRGLRGGQRSFAQPPPRKSVRHEHEILSERGS
jgi:hypothetical protein